MLSISHHIGGRGRDAVKTVVNAEMDRLKVNLSNTYSNRMTGIGRVCSRNTVIDSFVFVTMSSFLVTGCPVNVSK